jgi:hypothetical protein
MAENKAVIEVEVQGTGKAQNSLAQLKKDLKEAKALALNGDGAAAKRVAELTDKMEDLADSTKALKGTGLERAEGSFRLLGESIKNLDFDKFKVALGGIKTALAATGVMLLVQGITYLVENFDNLSKGSGLLAKALRFVGDIIGAVKDAAYALTDALGLTNSELDKQGEAIKENADKAKEALDSQVQAYDRQIKAAQAAGKSTVELEKAKQQAIIDTNTLIAKQIAEFVRAGGELDDEKKKQLTAALNTIKNAVNEQQVIEIKADADKAKRNEEAAKKRKEDKDKSIADADALFKELSQQQDNYDKAQAAEKKALDDRRAKDLEDLKNLSIKQMQEESAAQIEKWANEDKLRQLDIEKAKQAEEQKKKDKEAITAASLGAAVALSEAFFAIQLSRVKKGSAEELKLKKKQFEIDKALKVVQAVQSGITGVQAQFAAGPIVGPILAGLVAVTAAANVAKLLATKFDGGSIDVGSSGGSSAATPSAATTSTPNIQATAIPNVQSSTTFDDKGKVQQPIYVSVVDINNAQSREARLTDQARV